MSHPPHIALLLVVVLLAGALAACASAPKPAGDPMKAAKATATAELEVVGEQAARDCHSVERWDRITVEFAVVVNPDGTVATSRSDSRDTTPDMQRCIKSQLALARFSPHEHEPFWVKTTVRLSWGRDG